MKIAICGSIQFSKEMIELKKKLEASGHTAVIPFSTEKIGAGHLSLDEYMKEKDAHGDLRIREEAGRDLIKDHYEKIIASDVMVMVNHEKKSIPGYIGGNALMEMGFAYVNNKKIFLLNDIPDMSYTDEIRAMHPIVIHGDLSQISD